uniref:dynein heavy chain 5, axonemal-like n=1 Tax=Maylandia zebra TaxID=106582 RepID=UPI000D303453
MLLSNEARREVAKQARAVKEERRAALDARHKYLMSRLADAGSLEEAAVEDAIVSDDRFSLIHEFFAANGSKKLIFFYQDVKQCSETNPLCTGGTNCAHLICFLALISRYVSCQS